MMLRFDVASGGTALDAVDLRLGGVLPYFVARQYRSGSDRASQLGPGWSHGWDVTLEATDESVTCRGGVFDGVEFAALPPGREAVQEESGFVLQHHAETYVLFASPRRRLVFSKAVRRGASISLTAVRDASGNSLGLAYQSGRLDCLVDPEGRRLRFIYSGDRVTGLRFEAGGQVRMVRSFAYTMRGDLASVTDSSGNTTRYAYDGGLLVEVAHPSGNTQWAQYDEDRRCVALWSSSGDIVHAHHDPLRQVIRVVDGDGGQTLFQHVLGRQLLERIAHEGQSQNYYYDEIERLIGYSLDDGIVAAFHRHDPEERKISLVDREERVGFLHVDEQNNVIVAEDAFDHRWLLHRGEDALVNVLVTPSGNEWSFERDRTGRITAVVSPAGRRAEVKWAGRDRRVRFSGSDLHDGFDEQGRHVQHTDCCGRLWNRRYDQEGRLAEVAQQNGYAIEFGYVAEGDLAYFADTERERVRIARDTFGRPTHIEINGTRVALGHDPSGRLTSIKSSDRSASVDYDSLGRLAAIRGADGQKAFVYDYEDGGVSVTDHATTRRYNALGELIGLRSAEASEQFTYGPSGELLVYETSSDGGCMTALLDHDGEGLPAELSISYDDHSIDLRFEFDSEGALMGVEGEDVSMRVERDEWGRPALVRSGDVAVELVCDAGYRISDIAAGPDRFRIICDSLDRPHRIDGDGGGDFDLRTVPGRQWEHRWQQDGAVPLVIRATERGVIIYADIGGVALPLHQFGDLRAPLLDPARALALGVVRGSGHVLRQPPRGSQEVLARWRSDRRWNADHCALPEAEAIGTRWHVLEGFFLNAEFQEAHAERIPGTLPVHQGSFERTANDSLTGPHARGCLRPRPWGERSVGHLIEYDLLLKEGRLDAEEVARFLLRK